MIIGVNLITVGMLSSYKGYYIKGDFHLFLLIIVLEKLEY